MDDVEASRRELTITALAFGGDGVAREEKGPTAGRVVFVPGTVPGDRVAVELVRERKDLAWARRLEVLEPGPGRVEPACPLVGHCGGCSWGHVATDVQTDARLKHVSRALDRLDGEWPAPVFAGSPSLGYRHRIRLQLVPTREGVLLGFHEAGSHRIVNIRECPIASTGINESLPGLRGVLEGWETSLRGSVVVASNRTGTTAVSVRLSGGDGEGLAQALVDAGIGGAVVSWAEESEDAGEPVIQHQVGESEVPVHVANFSQANPVIADAIASELVAALPPEAGEGRMLELFAGSGTWTAQLAKRVGHLTAIEGNDAAVDALRAMAAERSWEHVEVEERDLGSALGLAEFDASTNVVLLDPPREGARPLMAPIAAMDPDCVLYISCDVMTLARDLRELISERLVPRRVVVFDMFPNTSHTEVLVVLGRPAN
jgi:23S rRNA (uracil1939-C5)-methyltransferase